MAVEDIFLKTLPHFKGLNNDQLVLVSKLVFEKKVERGDLIAIEGEPAGALYFVYSGAVKTFRTSIDGKEQVLNIVRPGESFNDVAIYDNGINLASARAMGTVGLYGILKNDLLAFLDKHPQTFLNIIRILTVHIRYLVSLIDDLSFKPVVGRVAKILFEYAGNGAPSAQRITQQDMAAIAGTAREVIGRSLKALERNGIIKFDRHRIVITDKDALKNIAGISN